MFNKFKSKVKNLVSKAQNKVQNIVSKVKLFFATVESMLNVRFRAVLGGTAAEAYVDTGVKVLIAVVLGALLLALLYALFNDTIMPNVKAKVIELFNYVG